MGGGKSGASGTTYQQSQVQIPPEVMARYNAVNSRAEAAAATPWQPYGGQFVAPVNPTQQGGINTITGAAGIDTPYFQQATNVLNQSLGPTGQLYGTAAQQVGQGYGAGTGYTQQGINTAGGATSAAMPFNGLAAGQLNSAYGNTQPLNNAAIGLAAGATGQVNPGDLNIGQYMSPYNEGVVQSTLANLRQDQAMGRADLRDQQIMSNSFGGDRSGVADANLQRQQNLAYGQTAAQLYNANYGQALGAAQQQQGVGLSAAQANRAALASGAQNIAGIGQQQFGQGAAAAQGNLGIGQQVYGQGQGLAATQMQGGNQLFQQGAGAATTNANLAQGIYGTAAGAAGTYGQLGTQQLQNQLTQGQAQVGAGTVQQQTQQAEDTAKYQQFMQEKGYPFQVAQFLANIAMGTGAQSGSTTNTVTGSPQPFFSDERLKENVHVIGKTTDGQPIIRYNYKGDPSTQIGLSAQETEKHHPDAVGLSSGFKTVDYDAATRDSIAKAGGGGLSTDMAGILAQQRAMYPGAHDPRGIASGVGPHGIAISPLKATAPERAKVDMSRAQQQQQQPSGAKQTVDSALGMYGTGKDLASAYNEGKETFVGKAGTKAADGTMTNGTQGWFGSNGELRVGEGSAAGLFTSKGAGLDSGTIKTEANPPPVEPPPVEPPPVEPPVVVGDAGSLGATATADAGLGMGADLFGSVRGFANRGGRMERAAGGGALPFSAADGYIPDELLKPVAPDKPDEAAKIAGGQPGGQQAGKKDGTGKAIGSLVGGIAGSYFGPIGSMAGSTAGGMLGGMVARGGRVGYQQAGRVGLAAGDLETSDDGGDGAPRSAEDIARAREERTRGQPVPSLGRMPTARVPSARSGQTGLAVNAHDEPADDIYSTGQGILPEAARPPVPVPPLPAISRDPDGLGSLRPGYSAADIAARHPGTSLDHLLRPQPVPVIVPGRPTPPPLPSNPEAAAIASRQQTGLGIRPEAVREGPPVVSEPPATGLGIRPEAVREGPPVVSEPTAPPEAWAVGPNGSGLSAGMPSYTAPPPAQAPRGIPLPPRPPVADAGPPPVTGRGIVPEAVREGPPVAATVPTGPGSGLAAGQNLAAEQAMTDRLYGTGSPDPLAQALGSGATAGTPAGTPAAAPAATPAGGASALTAPAGVTVPRGFTQPGGQHPADAPYDPATYTPFVFGRETNGRDYNNPNWPTAAGGPDGPAQFIPGTWQGFVQARPDLFAGKSPAEIDALRRDPAMSKLATEWYADKNSGPLRAAGVPLTNGNLYMAHMLDGPPAASLLANPSMDAVEALKKAGLSDEQARASITKNGGTIGMTAGQFAELHKYKRASGAPAQASSLNRPAEPQGGQPPAGPPAEKKEPDFIERAGNWIDKYQRPIMTGLAFIGNMLGSKSNQLTGAIGDGLAAAAPMYLATGYKETEQKQGQERINITGRAQFMQVLAQQQKMQNDYIYANNGKRSPELDAQMAQTIAQITALGGTAAVPGGAPDSLRAPPGAPATGRTDLAPPPASAPITSTPLPPPGAPATAPAAPPPGTYTGGPPAMTDTFYGQLADDRSPKKLRERSKQQYANGDETGGARLENQARKEEEDILARGYGIGPGNKQVKLEGWDTYKAQDENRQINQKWLQGAEAKTQARISSLQNLDKIKDIVENYETGTGASWKAQAAGYLSAAGLPVLRTDTTDQEAFAKFLKDSYTQVLSQGSSGGGETDNLRGMIERSFANPNLPPEANKAILSQVEGQLRYEDAYSTYMAERIKDSQLVDQKIVGDEWRAKDKEKNNPEYYRAEAYRNTAVLGATPDNPAELKNDHVYMLTPEKFAQITGADLREVKAAFADKNKRAIRYRVTRDDTGKINLKAEIRKKN